jgi:predicted kinase
LLGSVKYIIVEIHSSSQEQFEIFKSIAEKNNADLISILLRPPLKVCIERNSNRQVNDISYEITESMVKKYYKLHNIKDDIFFDTLNMSPQKIADSIVSVVNK